MELLLRARELAGARKFRESRALVERAEPESAEELSLAASVLLQLRDPEAALPLAERAVRLAPDDWRGWVAVADADLLLGRTDAAVAAARTAVGLASDEAAPHRVLGAALNKVIGCGAEARQELKRAKELGGGRKALLMPGRPSPWGFAVLAAFLLFGTLTFVGDWPDGLKGVFQILRTASLLGLLFFLRAPRRAGLAWRARTAEMRAANERLYGGGGREASVKAATALAPWGAAVGGCTMLLAGLGTSGNPVPLWVVLPVVPIGGCLLLVAARRWVRWWYGERFLREVFAPDVLVRVHLVAAGALLGGILLLALGDAEEQQWKVLLLGGLGWLVLASIGTPFAAGIRDGVRKDREKAADA
ncbi:hypothetical protein GCM10011579_011160 [Streptomyces albiflavescens]|uniref:Tetratricopeptide repeat protein n=1 Tax=Streptomyces albiflavescens TaxID=1623582 RepID=A0A917XU21_9ACTN|nr:tetratricopeptide repeat protein [Streptomyces albiflavescens]GGN53225.1 hypothetical protein GCM10011579_011160 [Streptomyces albiflavescens]